MSVQKLKAFLDGQNIKYVAILHSKAYTAQGIAALTHISGKELTKTVIVKLDDALAMCLWNPRIVVYTSDLAVFQYPHELIWREEKLTKGLAQHGRAQVLSRVGFSEGNNIRDTSRVHE